MLTRGHLPFNDPSKNVHNICEKIKSDPIIWPQEYEPSPEAKDLVDKLTDKNYK